MKKKIQILSFVALAGWLFSSCSLNDFPKFDDKDAFVAFSSASISVNESAGTINIPVTLVSLEGVSSTVSFTYSNGTAIQGEDFIPVGSNSLTFSPGNPVQNIQVQIVNKPGVFTGDVSFSIELDNTGSVNLGAAKKMNITILDLDHPLTPILGTYTATGESGFNGEQSWTITLSKDANDVSKVWITNFIVGGSSSSTPIYGIVDDEMTEIRIPVNQVIATSSSYDLIRLEGWYGDEDEDDIEDGGYITIIIAKDFKSMTIMDGIISAVYYDSGATDIAGWYNYFEPGVIMIKD